VRPGGRRPAGGAPGFDVIDRLRRLAEGGTKMEKRLAAFVLDNARLASTGTIAEIAERCETSEPTVTRFARALGCAGTADFKFRLAQALARGEAYLGAPTAAAGEADGTRAQAMDTIHDGALGALNRLRAGLDGAVVERMALRLANSRRILAFGSGGTSSMMARELENRLFRLGLDIRAETDGQMQRMLASVAGPGTVVLALSVSGQGRSVVEATAIARGYGAETLAITAPGSPLAASADAALHLPACEDGNLYKPSSGRYAFLALVDILALATAEAVGPRLFEGLRRIRQNLNTHAAPDPALPIGD
jgi:DNA-binding MurR/RpiR family transcriptional regulator